MDDDHPPAPQRPATRAAARRPLPQAQPPQPAPQQGAQPQQGAAAIDVDRADRRNKNLCPECRTLIKRTDGGRTCAHVCAALNFELGADTVNKSVTIVDAWDTTIAQVAYVRGISGYHGQSELLNEIEAAMHLTETPLSPDEESSTADSGPADSEQSNEDPDDPDSPPNMRRGSGIRYNILDETSDEEPASPQPGPSGHQAVDFAALLNASRDAARNVRHSGSSSPGQPTQEAPPTQPINPAINLPRDSSSDDSGPSPPHTRSGRIRGPPTAPKKRK